MGYKLIAAVLQSALLILAAAQAPNVSRSLHYQAIQVVNQAITLATDSLSTSAPSSTTAAVPLISSSPPTLPPTISETQQWSIYINSNGFRFSYPSDWSLNGVSSTSESNLAHTAKQRPERGRIISDNRYTSAPRASNNMRRIVHIVNIISVRINCSSCNTKSMLYH